MVSFSVANVGGNSVTVDENENFKNGVSFMVSNSNSQKQTNKKERGVNMAHVAKKAVGKTTAGKTAQGTQSGAKALKKALKKEVKRVKDVAALQETVKGYLQRLNAIFDGANGKKENVETDLFSAGALLAEMHDFCTKNKLAWARVCRGIGDGKTGFACRANLIKIETAHRVVFAIKSINEKAPVPHSIAGAYALRITDKEGHLEAQKMLEVCTSLTTQGVALEAKNVRKAVVEATGEAPKKRKFKTVDEVAEIAVANLKETKQIAELIAILQKQISK